MLLTVAPEFMTTPKSQTTNEGSNVTFSCVATGVPGPSLSWSINGIAKHVTANPRISFSADNKQLTVTNVNRIDRGEYRCTCVASNKVDNVSALVATLTVHCK